MYFVQVLVIMFALVLMNREQFLGTMDQYQENIMEQLMLYSK